jgi:hypothetical protein
MATKLEAKIVDKLLHYASTVAFPSSKTINLLHNVTEES